MPWSWLIPDGEKAEKIDRGTREHVESHTAQPFCQSAMQDMLEFKLLCPRGVQISFRELTIGSIRSTGYPRSALTRLALHRADMGTIADDRTPQFSQKTQES